MQTERLDFSQPVNDLTTIADLQRKSLLVKNDYKTISVECECSCLIVTTEP